MPVTREFRETVRARIRQDRKYPKELLREGVVSLLAALCEARAVSRRPAWRARPLREYFALLMRSNLRRRLCLAHLSPSKPPDRSAPAALRSWRNSKRELGTRNATV